MSVQETGLPDPPGAHRVVAVCPDGVIAFDLATAAQVFTLAASGNGRPLYRFSTASEGGAAVASTGFAIDPQHGLEALEEAETVVVPASFAVLEPPSEALAEALRAVAARGSRIVSVCTGAFTLAHAGLLDGRAATTHWAWAEVLAERFPTIDVDPAALYVDEGDRMTSAGLSAGIDLCLHIVRKDHGASVGERVARHMVAAPHRDGGQAQFIERPATGFDGSLERTRTWVVERLAESVDVAAMAGHAGVSPRTFARRFRAETGTTPHQWLLGRRLLEARRLLEETDLPIEEVAWRAGFGGAASLRQHFRRATSTTPSAYRRSFSPPAQTS